MGGGAKLAIAAGVALVMASGAHSSGHGGILASLTAIPVPSAGAYTPQSWAAAVLRAEGDPLTACNLGAITSWEAAEGGHWNNTAAYNPINTTYDGPGGSWLASGKVTATINSDGVRAYDSWHTGLVATITTLNLPAYAGIRSALAAGDSAQTVADAVAASPWGTGSFTASC